MDMTFNTALETFLLPHRLN